MDYSCFIYASFVYERCQEYGKSVVESESWAFVGGRSLGNWNIFSFFFRVTIWPGTIKSEFFCEQEQLAERKTWASLRKYLRASIWTLSLCVPEMLKVLPKINIHSTKSVCTPIAICNLTFNTVLVNEAYVSAVGRP